MAGRSGLAVGSIEDRVREVIDWLSRGVPSGFCYHDVYELEDGRLHRLGGVVGDLHDVVRRVLVAVFGTVAEGSESVVIEGRYRDRYKRLCWLQVKRGDNVERVSIEVSPTDMPSLGAEKVLKITVRMFLSLYNIVIASFSRCPEQ